MRTSYKRKQNKGNSVTRKQKKIRDQNCFIDNSSFLFCKVALKRIEADMYSCLIKMKFPHIALTFNIDIMYLQCVYLFLCLCQMFVLKCRKITGKQSLKTCNLKYN